jgi:restriction system protein
VGASRTSLGRLIALKPAPPAADSPAMTLGDATSVSRIDSLDGRASGRVLATVFAKLGFAVERTEDHDDGTDLLLEKDGVRTAVRAEWATNPVRQEALQNVVASLADHGCDETMVVTNGSYTERARELARSNHVTLWDGTDLARALTSFCVVCEARVSSQVRRWCLDRPEEFNGRVYCFEHQRERTGVLRIA